MNESRTHDPLEALVASALCADAEHAPTLPEEWRGGDGMSMSSAPQWSPPGTEFPSTDLGPATTVYNGPVVAALSRQVGIEDHLPQVVTTSLSYMGNATAVEMVCTSESGSSGWRPEWNPASWSTIVTSSVDNGSATSDLWTVEGIPADVAFVSYIDGDMELWQRPIMGFAAFPNVVGQAEVVIGYDADGIEVGRYGGELGEVFDGPVPLVASASPIAVNATE